MEKKFNWPGACSNCIHLGHWQNEEDKSIYCELYFCTENPVLTIIAAYSDNPSDTVTGWNSQIEPLMYGQQLVYEHYEKMVKSIKDGRNKRNNSKSLE